MIFVYITLNNIFLIEFFVFDVISAIAYRNVILTFRKCILCIVLPIILLAVSWMAGWACNLQKVPPQQFKKVHFWQTWPNLWSNSGKMGWFNKKK